MTQPLDPSQFIITRKRKKYKFAKFANAANCFELTEWIEKKPLQHKSRPVVLEIGAGNGLFSLEMAKRHPGRLYIALDVKADRLQAGAYQAIEQAIDNVYFLRARADQIDQLTELGGWSAIWLTFSDPFPKARSAGRRLTHPNFLRRYHQVLTDKGELLIKHDNQAFFEWTLEQLVVESWTLNQLTFDLHNSSLDDDYKILTNYEKRWLDQDLKTKFVKATKL